ncbi:C40 family peptidase [Bacillus tuaregi]|uniref:C40 family peptidase n=1 Tax=Bacillus tuaregi TaxID=1816695 RepID=UPI0009FC9AA3|nr:peptidoglycan endopeptidase [Bacillus tuaregi]
MEKMVATIATAAVLSTAFSSTALASSYTVQQGDTLFSIAKKHGTTVDQLKQWNGLESDQIFTNQKLKVAAETGAAVEAPAVAVPSVGVSAPASAQATAVAEAAPAQATALAETAPAQAGTEAVSTTVTTAATGSGTTYTVVKGDTLSAIAYRHGLSLSNLRSWNGLSGDLIYPGQVLKVAANGSVAPSSPGNTSGQGTGTSAASSSTYTVAAGDTLMKIANRYGISLAELQSWNGISGHLIYPGQVLKVAEAGGGTANISNPGTAPTAPTTGNAGGSEYVIKSGDTLGKIALQVGLNISQLKSLNGLTSDLIFPGQKLKISSTGGAVTTPPASNVNTGAGTNPIQVNNPTVAQVLDHAKKLVGVPYVYGGKTPAGFDCSGFIYYVFNQAGESISRLSAAGYYDRSFEVSSPQVGDLVFFKDTYIKGISHLGIYIGNGEFIHASSDGVDISSVDNVYWKGHFDSYKRFY